MFFLQNAAINQQKVPEVQCVFTDSGKSQLKGGRLHTRMKSGRLHRSRKSRSDLMEPPHAQTSLYKKAKGRDFDSHAFGFNFNLI